VSFRQVIRWLRTPVTLFVLLVVLGYGAWWGYKAVLTVPISTVNACVSQPVTQLTPDQVTVRVLNGGDVKGYATEVAKVLKARGYNISVVSNTNETITTPIIVGATADSPAVKLVASNFPEGTIRPDNRNDGTVDVLIGAKTDKTLPTTGFATSIAVPNGKACLPKSQGSTTPSTTPSANKT
jgi:LytR cell envelope-related transcriptional attenuator